MAVFLVAGALLKHAQQTKQDKSDCIVHKQTSKEDEFASNTLDPAISILLPRSFRSLLLFRTF